MVDCDTCREAVSARLDGETEPVPAADTDAHLAGCAACRGWGADAAALSRSLRLRPAAVVPDFAPVVLAAAATRPPRRRRGWPRPALAAVALSQVALGLSQVLWPTHGGHPAGAHLFNESTAWNLALGLGLLWAALRPRATAGVLPVVGVYVLALVPFSALDLAAGAVTPPRLVPHVILVVGVLLMVAVQREQRGPRGGSALDGGSEVAEAGEVEPGAVGAAAERPGRWAHLRPVSRRNAA